MESARTQGFDRFLWFISSLVVALMLASATITLIQFLHRLLPTWDAVYLPGFIFFLVLERWYLHRRMENLPVFSAEWFLTLGAEWIIIMIILRLLMVISNPSQILLGEILNWIGNYGEGFFSIEFIVVLIISIFTWLTSGHFAALIDEYNQELLDLDPTVMASLYKGRTAAREQIISSVFTIGAGMLVLTAITRADWQIFRNLEAGGNIFSLSDRYVGSANLLFFFILALVFLSISNYAALRRTWRTRGIIINRNVVRNWVIYSVVFLSLLGGIALILPTNYTVGLLRSLGFIVQFIFNIFVFLFGIVLFLIHLVIFLLSSLFGSDPANRDQQPLQPPVLDSEFLSPSTPGEPWFEVVKSVIFWLILAIIIGYAFFYFIKEHQEIVESDQKPRLIISIKNLFNRILGLFKVSGRQLARIVNHSVQRLMPRERQHQSRIPWDYLSLRQLNPRERIRFYYLALIRRAEEKGIPRSEDQTPSEYENVLKERYQEIDEEIHEVTSAFLKARYSTHLISESESNHIKTAWSTIRRAIRHFWRQSKEIESEGK